MKYLLDTNICIYIIKRKPKAVIDKFLSLTPGDVAISSITLAELHYGVNKSSRQEQNQLILSQFVLPLDIIDFDYESSIVYGEIRANLERAGTPIGSMDLLIAACAKSRDITLVTNNEKEFSRIEGLRIENWVV